MAPAHDNAETQAMRLMELSPPPEPAAAASPGLACDALRKAYQGRISRTVSAETLVLGETGEASKAEDVQVPLKDAIDPAPPAKPKPVATPQAKVQEEENVEQKPKEKSEAKKKSKSKSQDGQLNTEFSGSEAEAWSVACRFGPARRWSSYLAKSS